MKSDPSHFAGLAPVLAGPALGVLAAAPVTPSLVEVSVVLLEDEESLLAGATASMPSITDDVLAYLAESERESAADEPLQDEPLQDEPLQDEPLQDEPPREVDTLLVGVEELLGLGDVTSALALLHKAERCAPEDGRLAVARVRCEQVQRTQWEKRLGDTRQVPLLKLRMAELMKLSLDARMGFLLSRIDGRTSYEALFAVSGMSRRDTLGILVQLLDQDVILTRGASGTRVP
ncbi:hypothetical protein [Archangium primigenium]|uniref:hypothetical protein n=1 Tax=[Archangium] primigenium TaxID=2792470 RepID=UPI00195A843D|nr:hypothetical protein [Archangium primigenium]MBM7115345.1 hypothetical protein [Archangium primigenium]